MPSPSFLFDCRGFPLFLVCLAFELRHTNGTQTRHFDISENIQKTRCNACNYYIFAFFSQTLIVSCKIHQRYQRTLYYNKKPHQLWGFYAYIGYFRNKETVIKFVKYNLWHTNGTH